jgi:hypothetical protein
MIHHPAPLHPHNTVLQTRLLLGFEQSSSSCFIINSQFKILVGTFKCNIVRFTENIFLSSRASNWEIDELPRRGLIVGEDP